MEDRYWADLNTHYGSGQLADQIDATLLAAGISDQPTPEDLAPLDQFHSGGIRTTNELAERLAPQPGQTVIDVGGGIGGPARVLAANYGCTVTVVDLTEAFCTLGAHLSRRTGLADHVTFLHGNALDLPVDDASFDIGWTQHSTMNIDDKERLYRELQRVIKPGGRLALHEVMAGPVQPIQFPVPWARDPELSFLRPVSEIRALITATGFREISWVNTTTSATAWFQGWLGRQTAHGPSPLGLHLLLGSDMPSMGRNMLRNLEEQRIEVVQAIFERT